jgi:hypothetical protein
LIIQAKSSRPERVVPVVANARGRRSSLRLTASSAIEELGIAIAI